MRTALPDNPEEWVAAVTTLLLAIIAFIRKVKPPKASK